MLKIENLVGGYKDNRIINGIDLEINQGEFFTLLGPNGSGKTTLFKLITGQLTKQGGNVFLSGKEINRYSKLEKARKISVLTQESHVSFDYTVDEIVRLGRYPHQKGVLKQLSRQDRVIIDDVMDKTKISAYRDTPFRMISGGEKQRVLLAKALVQEPEILFLDEPTNHLDIKHTFEILDLIKSFQVHRGLTVIAILHDLNVASLYTDRVGLLENGRLLEVGDTDLLRKEHQLQRVYGVDVKTQLHPIIPKPQILLIPEHVKTKRMINFKQAYQIRKNSSFIHVAFDRPLRTIANSVVGEGIQWLSHFSNFRVDKHYASDEPIKDLKEWMIAEGIPVELSVGMMTAAELENVVIEIQEIETIPIMVVVTAGLGNAVDITNKDSRAPESQIGTINTMVFIDSHFTDGALINGYMSATEAKVKALQDFQIQDPATNTLATGTSTDALLLGLTQQGEKTPYAGSGTPVGRAIGQAVYDATAKAVKKYVKGR